jgi:hypothetical protein
MTQMRDIAEKIATEFYNASFEDPESGCAWIEARIREALAAQRERDAGIADDDAAGYFEEQKTATGMSPNGVPNGVELGIRAQTCRNIAWAIRQQDKGEPG